MVCETLADGDPDDVMRCPWPPAAGVWLLCRDLMGPCVFLGPMSKHTIKSGPSVFFL